MGALFDSYIYNPIFEVLKFIYYQNLSFHDLGLSIVILTVLIRLILLPVFYKGAKDQTIIQKIQPHIKKIQLDHKDDKEKQARELMALYKEHRINPFSSILFLLVQLPIFFALFRIFSKEITVAVFPTLSFFGLIQLNEKSLTLTIAAALLQYFQTKMTLAPKLNNGPRDSMAANQKMMMYIGPLITLIVLFNLPSAIGLYWTVSNLFSIIQQFFINKKINIPEATESVN
ncbi:MAG: YidC/Oxa1 family membrane protein insertase [Minisyncoccia bacterium]